MANCLFAVFVLPRVTQLGDSEFRLFLEYAVEVRSECVAEWICQLTSQLPSLAVFVVFEVFAVFAVFCCLANGLTPT